ncbi:MAG TPA: S8 family serine peptidase [Blastocatellia bacterium]|nr:S8 family serine peptidase [Blastocatellia bacterium]
MNTVHAQAEQATGQSEVRFVPGRLLVKFRDETPASRGREILSGLGARKTGSVPGTGVQIVELPFGANERAFAQAFKSLVDVEFAELDEILSPADVTPNDPWYANWQWELRKISGPSAWSLTTGSSSITIAICDTGVDATHPDLAAKMAPGWNTFNNNSNSSDVAGHGTAVAGTVAASANNAVGVASVAWGCKIMPIRVSDASGNATFSAIASGLNWAATRGARVANVSYIVTGSSTVTSAARNFQDAGGVVVSSAGNNGAFDSSPDNPYILTVSATSQSDVLESYSNRGNNIDLAAPGSAYSTTRGGGYGAVGGTSYSSPTVAGVAALVLSANPNLTASQVQDVLKQSVDDLGPAGWDSSYGWGRVNAYRAVTMASGGGAGDTTAPTVSFSSPAAGATVSATVSVQVGASDNVGVTLVNLRVDGVLMAGDNTAPYSFNWNTTTVANGAHNLTATAQDGAGNTSSATISVTVSNLSDVTPPTVNITSPVGGATVSGNVSVLVSSSDNVAVTKVELYVDGVLQSTATTSPFTNRWNARKERAGAHTLQCKAYDAAGNVGLSPAVTVYR